MDAGGSMTMTDDEDPVEEGVGGGYGDPADPLTSQELEERRDIVDAGSACLDEAGVPYEIVEQPDYVDIVPADEVYDRPEDELATVEETFERCVDTEALYAPSEAEVEAVNTQVQMEATCLRQENIPFTITTEAGLPYVELDATDPRSESKADDCYQEAVGATMADAAQLYLGEGDRSRRSSYRPIRCACGRPWGTWSTTPSVIRPQTAR